MFNFKNWQQVKAAYTANTAAVRATFDGFFSPGLISRMCVELYTSGSFDCCETPAQVAALTATLHGTPTVYDPAKDPEFAEFYPASE